MSHGRGDQVGLQSAAKNIRAVAHLLIRSFTVGAQLQAGVLLVL